MKPLVAPTEPIVTSNIANIFARAPLVRVPNQFTLRLVVYRLMVTQVEWRQEKQGNEHRIQ